MRQIGLPTAKSASEPSYLWHEDLILLMFADPGQGVAVMANSDNAIAAGDELLASIAGEYGWKFAHLSATLATFSS